jgi:hypothetical protein
MPRRPCLGCSRLTTRPDGRCPDCARARDAARGSRHARGYGSAHVARRDALLDQLRPGELCDRCWTPMHASQPLDAAHPHDRPLRTHPDSVADHLEHAACNRGERLPTVTPLPNVIAKPQRRGHPG